MNQTDYERFYRTKTYEYEQYAKAMTEQANIEYEQIAKTQQAERQRLDAWLESKKPCAVCNSLSHTTSKCPHK